ncbi:MAG: hypothetical protein K2J01_01890 [Clostridiales bacterium]|nr:hypothetical protein [Clostridiales bacterium]
MAKKLNVVGIVFFALIIVGLILAVVGMCVPIITMTPPIGESESVGLSHEIWDTLAKLKEAADKLNQDATIPTKTFTVIAFVVTLVGAGILAVNGILGLLGKDIKILGLVGGAVAIVGGILVLVAGLVLAGQFNDYGKAAGLKYSAGIGIWLGAIGGILAGAAGLLGALKVGQK